MSGAQLPVRPNSGPAWIVSVDPPVFLAGLPSEDYLGIARPVGERFGNIDAGFIIFPTWTWERQGFPEAMRADYLAHAAEYPRHVFRFACSTQRETNLLLAQGLPAEFLNVNFTLSEEVFRPLPDVAVEFDAIYNARFIPEKRHALAALIPRVAYLTYVDNSRFAEFEQIRAAISNRSPNHVLLNQVVDRRPAPVGKAEVNLFTARAAVGIILSAVEGSNYSSTEYMLAGLPVVSTPSVGGRDVYFDREYCIICDATPEAVRDAVAELKARQIPREYVRARTLDKIRPARERFLELVDEVLADLDADPQFGGRSWPFADMSGVGWAPYSKHLDYFARLGKNS